MLPIKKSGPKARPNLCLSIAPQTHLHIGDNVFVDITNGADHNVAVDDNDANITVAIADNVGEHLHGANISTTVTPSTCSYHSKVKYSSLQALKRTKIIFSDFQQNFLAFQFSRIPFESSVLTNIQIY